MIFVQEVRPKVIEQMPGIKTLDVMKEIGKRWANITQEDFAYYTEKAQKDKLRYLAESKVFYDEVAKVAEIRAPPEDSNSDLSDDGQEDIQDCVQTVLDQNHEIAPEEPVGEVIDSDYYENMSENYQPQLVISTWVIRQLKKP